MEEEEWKKKQAKDDLHPQGVFTPSKSFRMWEVHPDPGNYRRCPRNKIASYQKRSNVESTSWSGQALSISGK